MKKIFILAACGLVLLAGGLSFVGCATSNSIQTGGVYSGDVYLYNADQSFSASYQIIDSFLQWETANNTWVKSNSVATFNIANTIRAKTPSVIADYAKARSLYVNYFNQTNASLSFQNVSNGLFSAVGEIVTEASTATLVNTNITQ